MSNERAKRDLRRDSKKGKPVTAADTRATYGTKKLSEAAELAKTASEAKKKRLLSPGQLEQVQQRSRRNLNAQAEKREDEYGEGQRFAGNDWSGRRKLTGGP